MRYKILMGVLIVLLGGLVVFVRWVQQFAVSKEATQLRDSVRPEVVPDHLSFIHDRCGHGIKPESNALIPLLTVVPLRSLSITERQQASSILGHAVPDSSVPALISWKCFVVGKEFPDLVDKNQGYPNNLPDDDPRSARFRSVLDKADSDYEYCKKHPWATQRCPLMYEWLCSQEKPLRLIVGASKRQFYFSPLVSNAGREIGGVFQVSPTLVLEPLLVHAMWQCYRGELDAGWESVLACLRLIRLGSGSYPQEAQSFLCFCDPAFGAVQTLIRDGRMSDSHLTRAIHDLADLPRVRDLAGDIDLVDRWLVLKGLFEWAHKPIKVMYADMPTPEPITDEVCDQALAILNTYFDEIVVALKEPDYERRRHEVERIYSEYKKRLEVKSEVDDPAKVALSYSAEAVASGFLVDYTFLVSRQARFELMIDVVQTGFALEAFSRAAGKFPERLEQVMPKYLNQLPVKTCTGYELHYQPKKGGYSLSVNVSGLKDSPQSPLKSSWTSIGPIAIER